MAILKVGDRSADVLTRMVAEDKVPWHKKPNLRGMYMLLFCCCMGVEMTSGFDSQLINTLQFSDSFRLCKSKSVFNIAASQLTVTIRLWPGIQRFGRKARYQALPPGLHQLVLPTRFRAGRPHCTMGEPTFWSSMVCHGGVADYGGWRHPPRLRSAR